jgi:hypothetical protein
MANDQLEQASAPDLAYTFTTIDPPDSSSVTVTGINNQGEVVGYYGAAGVSYGFVYDKGSYLTIDAPDASFTMANAINDQGFVAGVYMDPDSIIHGYIYKARALTIIDFPGIIETHPTSINSR